MIREVVELPITLFVLLLYFTLDKFGVITLQLSEYIDARDFPFSLYFGNIVTSTLILSPGFSNAISDGTFVLFLDA